MVPRRHDRTGARRWLRRARPALQLPALPVVLGHRPAHPPEPLRQRIAAYAALDTLRSSSPAPARAERRRSWRGGTALTGAGYTSCAWSRWRARRGQHVRFHAGNPLLLWGATTAARARASAEARTTLPPGFVEQDSGLSLAGGSRRLAWAPDGSLLSTSTARCGSGTRAWPAVRVPRRQPGNQARGQRPRRGSGLHQPSSGDYCSRQAPPVRNRLSRFTYNGTALVSEVVLLNGPLVVNANRNRGDIQFAADKTLFLAMGNDEQDPTSQIRWSCAARSCTCNATGPARRTTQLADGVSSDAAVWGAQMRNPYRVAIEPGSGNLLIADVGWFCGREISRGIRGANYGWPTVDGPARPEFPAGCTQSTPTPMKNGCGDHRWRLRRAGGLRRYEGDYFLGDFVPTRAVPHPARWGNPASVQLWATRSAASNQSSSSGRNGALFYVSFGGGGIPVGCVKRIAYSSGSNRQPIAGIGDSGQRPRTARGGPQRERVQRPRQRSARFLLGHGRQLGRCPRRPRFPLPAWVYFADLTVSDNNGGADRLPSIRIVSGNRRPAVQDRSLRWMRRPTRPDSRSRTAAQHPTPRRVRVPCSQRTWQVVRHAGTYAQPVVGRRRAVVQGHSRFPTAGRVRPTSGTRSSTRPAIRVRRWSRRPADGRERRVAPAGHFSLTFETEPLADLALTLDGGVVVAALGAGHGRLPARHRRARRSGPGTASTYRWLSWSDGENPEHDPHAAHRRDLPGSVRVRRRRRGNERDAGQGHGERDRIALGPGQRSLLSAGPSSQSTAGTAQPSAPPRTQQPTIHATPDMQRAAIWTSAAPGGGGGGGGGSLRQLSLSKTS